MSDYPVSAAQRSERRKLAQRKFSTGYRYRAGDEWVGSLDPAEKDEILKRVNRTPARPRG